jgi:hypothetical protein
MQALNILQRKTSSPKNLQEKPHVWRDVSDGAHNWTSLSGFHLLRQWAISQSPSVLRKRDRHNKHDPETKPGGERGGLSSSGSSDQT